MFPYSDWQGKPLVISRRAQEELEFEGLDVHMLVELLDAARPSGERRKEGIRELVVERGERAFKIVVVESLRYSTGELVHFVVHLKSVRRT